ncbi:fused D-ribose transporter subunits of ABC superfamily: ATP-binding components [Bradyrhizobium sp. ORS 375]|uniref:sugar ABC transporter ATP-binding protein n=1 Tax=Bradyrhizobium sp. (strain ORS 375) TaxID=566679 RepID=UPI0002408637|nr:sugar ABC transporter ATP-binding protein [Bradyrhizobium sp. ORS 375]CCD96141.1 fused D-ribose transporter subunits of ABC superfamily: ATP-binding components [Bradyrhizobium sp. ORS 375]
MSDSAEITAAPPAPLLELRGISKQFPGVKALDDVSFAVYPGEVHMLLGENGAGKSSLMKILCGAYSADAGEVYYKGEKVDVSSTAEARKLGIAVIFQEFSLVPFLDIAQNIFLGREPKGRWPGIIDRRRILRDAKRVLDSIGFEIDPSVVVDTLGVAQQQMVEIAKAISQDARILVMDEPTAALSDREADLLFALIGRLKADGVAIVYISHRMAEVFAIGDRITVLRDGRRIDQLRPADVTPDHLVRMMVGRNVDMSYPRHFAERPGEVVLQVKGLSAATGISDIDIEVRRGEIVGLCGLVGSGRTEVARAIFGADPVSEGEIIFDGKPIAGEPDVAARRGIALIPESRKSEGLALLRSVGDNLVVAALNKLFPRRLYDPSDAQRTADGLIRQLRIATPSARQAVGLLSGGNQQKVVIGKWLAAGAKLFIFDEPTRGIDVGAKSEIFALIDRLVAEGAAALMISSEQIEICHVCDRAYVMRDGRIAGHLTRSELTEENIVRLGMHDE